MQSILEKGFINDRLKNLLNETEYSVEEHKDIAIIGMGIRMPNADNIDEFWNIIKNGIDCLGSFPKSREKNVKQFLNNKYNNKKVGFVKGSYIRHIEQFDASFWGITPKEAKLMDPVQRLFLETAFETLETAGYCGKQIDGSNTGVYVGMISDIDIHSYKEMIRENNPNELPIAVTGTLRSIMAARLAYYLNLKGPVLMTDTACSSSLVAIHTACQALRNGECTMAIAAGAKINLTPIDNECYKIGIESSDGVTRTFDNSANGSGFGEGVAVLLLKPLEKAKKDGDNIHAVIKGSAVNHDGASAGLTIPNADAQESVLIEAWKNAKIDPKKISYIECHGTATKLGDPIEIDAITSAFSRYTDKKNFCAVGSIKSNVGHLFDCAGIAGVIKVILALKNNKIPPSINFEHPNDAIDFINSPVYVNSVLKNWDSDSKKRYCGVSSFGIGGVNCHLILEEAEIIQDEIISNETNNYEIFVLTAKTQKALLMFIKKYIEFLEVCDETIFKNVCYTTNIGKKDYEYRIAVVARNCKELQNLLFQLYAKGLDSNKVVEDVWAGKYKANSDVSITKENEQIHWNLKLDSSKETLLRMCAKFIEGKEIDWLYFYKNQFIKRVSVPSYPFEREEYWFDYIKQGLQNEKKEVQPNMFYQVRYIKNNNYCKKEKNKESRTLVISDARNVSIIERLKQKYKNITIIIAGDEFVKLSDDLYSMQLCIDNFINFFNECELKQIRQIIYAVSLENNQNISIIGELQHQLNTGFYGLLHLTQTMSLLKDYQNIDLVIISHSSYEVDGFEEEIHPHNAALVGLGRNINLEFSRIKCRVIDISKEGDIEDVLQELDNITESYFVAYRNHERYVEQFSCTSQIEHVKMKDITIKSGGVYIITGGLGNIGLYMAEHFAEKSGVKIILISRSGLPERKEWDNILANNKDEKMIGKIRRIKKMEDNGNDISILHGDISCEKDVKSAILFVKQKYRVINGIIHAAGITGVGFLADKKLEQIQKVINPKILGTWLLDFYTTNEDLDFFVMCSSGAGIMGEIGLADYTAANAYMDSFAFYRGRKSRSLAIDWVVWENARMSEGFSRNIDGFFNPLDNKNAMNCFDIVLTWNVKRILIGEINFKSDYLNTIDHIPMLIEEDLKNKIGQAIEDNGKGKRSNEGSEIIVSGGASENDSDIEYVISKLVCNVLGYHEINIDDNFFELGVNSILLNYIWKEIDAMYPGKVMISDLFACPSVSLISKFVSEKINLPTGKEEKKSRDINENSLDHDIDLLFDQLHETKDIDDVISKIVVLK